MVFWVGFVMFFYLLILVQNEIDWNWQSLFDLEVGEWFWLEYLLNLFYVLVLVVWELIYVVCGFIFYLNWCIELEVWDIELVFCCLCQCLVGSVYVLLFGLIVLLVWLFVFFVYVELVVVISVGEVELLFEQVCLLWQKFNSEQVGKQIWVIVDGVLFKNSEIVMGWCFGDKIEKKDSCKEDEEWFKVFFEVLVNWVLFCYVV